MTRPAKTSDARRENVGHLQANCKLATVMRKIVTIPRFLIAVIHNGR